nr:DUF2164 domain-containing protein [uncultured Anaeromusa sp.]
MKQSVIALTPETKKLLLANLQNYYGTEREEELSEFQAGLLLEFILSDIGVYIYNQAIADAQKLMQQKAEELFALEKRVVSKM